MLFREPRQQRRKGRVNFREIEGSLCKLLATMGLVICKMLNHVYKVLCFFKNVTLFGSLCATGPYVTTVMMSMIMVPM